MLHNWSKTSTVMLIGHGYCWYLHHDLRRRKKQTYRIIKTMLSVHKHTEWQTFWMAAVTLVPDIRAGGSKGSMLSSISKANAIFESVLKSPHILSLFSLKPVNHWNSLVMQGFVLFPDMSDVDWHSCISDIKTKQQVSVFNTAILSSPHHI